MHTARFQEVTAPEKPNDALLQQLKKEFTHAEDLLLRRAPFWLWDAQRAYHIKRQRWVAKRGGPFAGVTEAELAERLQKEGCTPLQILPYQQEMRVGWQIRCEVVDPNNGAAVIPVVALLLPGEVTSLTSIWGEEQEWSTLEAYVEGLFLKEEGAKE